MSRFLNHVTLGLIVTFAPLAILADEKPLPPMAQSPSFADLHQLGQIKVPTLEQARQQAFLYVSQIPGGSSRWAAIEPIWSPHDSRTLLDRTIDTFVLIEPTLADYIKSIRLQASTQQLNVPLLKDAKCPPFVTNNLKLFLARALTNKRLHEDALTILRGLTPESLVDPASYYFYRAVCENKLRLKNDGLVSTNRLLASMQQSAPERYLVVAGLMQDEMSKWEDQDLGDVARRMEEIEARLDNAHGGAKTQEKQREVINLLDKLIKDLEDQCQKCNSSGGGQAKSQAPAGDSKIMNGAGPGEVENKKLIITAEVWGKMPEKEKVKALEAVNRQLPAHIREAAEGFSKKLQTGGK